MSRFVIGCDPASRVDFAGVVVNEPEGVGHSMIHRVRHIERLRGMSYTLLAQKIKNLVDRLRLAGQAEIVIALDSTGAGIPVADLFREAGMEARLVPITFTAGNETRSEHGSYFVPKKVLIATLGLAIETGRLLLAEGMKHAADLRREFEAFKQTLSPSGHSSFEAAAGAHDDLISALALAVWLGEREAGSGAWPAEGFAGDSRTAQLRRWY